MSFDHKFTCYKNASRSHGSCNTAAYCKTCERVNRLYKRSFALKGIERKGQFSSCQTVPSQGRRLVFRKLQADPGNYVNGRFTTYTRRAERRRSNFYRCRISPTFLHNATSYDKYGEEKNASPPRARVVRPHSFLQSLFRTWHIRLYIGLYIHDCIPSISSLILFISLTIHTVRDNLTRRREEEERLINWEKNHGHNWTSTVVHPIARRILFDDGPWYSRTKNQNGYPFSTDVVPR